MVEMGLHTFQITIGQIQNTPLTLRLVMPLLFHLLEQNNVSMGYFQNQGSEKMDANIGPIIK